MGSGYGLDADVVRFRSAFAGNTGNAFAGDGASSVHGVVADPTIVRQNLDDVKNCLIYMRSSTMNRQPLNKPYGPFLSFQPADELSQSLKEQAPAPAITVFCHHDPEHHPNRPFFNDLRISHNYARQLPEQIAGHINNMDLPPGPPVLLLSCRSGNSEYGTPSAQIIAQKTGRPVVAPNGWVKVGENWMDQYSKQSHPVGRTWKVLYPNGHEEVLLNVDNG